MLRAVRDAPAAVKDFDQTIKDQKARAERARATGPAADGNDVAGAAGLRFLLNLFPPLQTAGRRGRLESLGQIRRHAIVHRRTSSGMRFQTRSGLGHRSSGFRSTGLVQIVPAIEGGVRNADLF